MHVPVKRAEPARADVFTKAMSVYVKDVSRMALNVLSDQKLAL